MILPVYIEPNDILHKVAEPITEITPEIRELASNMRETMHNANGIGLAAPQIGRMIDLIVLEYANEESPEDLIPYTVMLNPKIIWRSSQKNIIEEGCLSIPGIYGNVKRPKKVTVQFEDLGGKQRELTVEGLFARIVQHEIDHLKGILFTEYVPEERQVYRKPPIYPQA